MHNIFINVDKSKEELKSENDLRNRLHHRYAAGELDIIIGGGKIVIKRLLNIQEVNPVIGAIFTDVSVVYFKARSRL